jgi:hypothetical protein
MEGTGSPVIGHFHVLHSKNEATFRALASTLCNLPLHDCTIQLSFAKNLSVAQRSRASPDMTEQHSYHHYGLGKTAELFRGLGMKVFATPAREVLQAADTALVHQPAEGRLVRALLAIHTGGSPRYVDSTVPACADPVSNHTTSGG